MTPQGQKNLKDILILHEGFRQFPYMDTTGHLTIGIGRNLNTRGISNNEALNLLDDDIAYFSNKLSVELPYFNSLDDVRKIVLVNMCFNLGFNGLLEFKNMLDAIQKRKWEQAAANIISSKAYQQAPNRYRQLADMMQTGQLSLPTNKTGELMYA